MKNLIHIKKNICLSIVTIMLCSIGNIQAQSVFRHIVSSTNTKGHISSINHSSTNGKKDKILIVTHNYGTSGPYQIKAIGAWYNGKKWTIFNQDRTPLKAKTQFNVLVINKGTNAFIVKAGTNTKAIKINHAKLNNNPNAAFLITQNWGSKGPYNTSSTGVYYAGGYWYIFNTDGKRMPTGSKFNVLIHPNIFKHKVTPATKKNHITYVNSSKTNNQTKAIVFATFNSQTSIKSYNNPIGVWYSANKWTVYNENKKGLKGNEAYNLLALGKKTNSATSGPIVFKGPVRKHKKPTTTVIKDPVRITTKTPVYKNIGLIRVPKKTDEPPKNTDKTGADFFNNEIVSSLLQGDEYRSFLEKLNIHSRIYPDKNVKNTYYYLPDTFSLSWNKETNEYGFNIYYMSSEEGRGSVLINAEISPNIDHEDIKIAENVLSKKLGKRISLLPMELRATPTHRFGTSLANLNVEEESVSVSIPTDYHKPIIIDWRMDSNVDNFVGAMLNDIPPSMKLVFQPFGDEDNSIEVPIYLKVNSEVTFGKIEFESVDDLQNGWTNNLDYPAAITDLVVIRQQGNHYYFESIPINSDIVAKGDTYTLDASIANQLISGKPVKELWFDYAIDSECNDCNQEVKRKIIGGTSGSQITNIEVQVLNALEYSDAHSMKLMVRSIQGDPNGFNTITFPSINITEDDKALDGVQLFLPEGKEIDYEYQLTMIMKDGEVRNSYWQKSNASLLVIGESQIKKLFKHTEPTILEKAKDSVMEKGKEDLIEKGKELLGSIFEKKKKDGEEKKENDENNEEENN